MRHGQLDQLDPQDVQKPIGTPLGRGQGTCDPGTGSTGKVPRDRVLFAGEGHAVVAVQPDENVAGAVGQGDGGRNEKVARPQEARNEVVGQDSQGQRRDWKVRYILL